MNKILTLIFALTVFASTAFAQCPNTATAPSSATIIFLVFGPKNDSAAEMAAAAFLAAQGSPVTFFDAAGNSITGTMTVSGNASKLRIDITAGTRPNPLSFELGDCTIVAGAILPVSLSSFTAKKMEKSILLGWETETEINNDYFAVERSTDGRDFEQLTEVSGNGNSTGQITYDFEDRNPESAINYYRLRQVDYDGTEAFSEIITVNFTDIRLDLNLYPTLAREEVNLDLTNFANEDVVIKVLDGAGRIVLNKAINGREILTLDLESLNLSEGMYYVHCQSASQTTTGKFLVVK